MPSAVSAVKVDGRRAYARVRAGEEVELAAPAGDGRPAGPAGRRRPAPELLDLDVAVDCSSGTYVRALARDLGAALGVGGHLTALRRTRVGPFTLADALTLEQLAERADPVPVPLDAAVAAAFPRRDLDAAAAARLAHGGGWRRSACPARTAPSARPGGSMHWSRSGTAPPAPGRLPPRRLSPARPGPTGRRACSPPGTRLGQLGSRREGAVLRWRGLDSTPSGWGRCVVTIGVFDGVHRGHQQIIARAVQRARDTAPARGGADLRPAPERGGPPRVAPGDAHPAAAARPTCSRSSVSTCCA